MTIKNLTRKSIITENGITVKGYLAEMFGMIFYKNPQSMIFQTRFGLHTFLMRYPIDIVILNDKNQVISLKKRLKPYRLFFWNPSYNLLIELPEGTIDKTLTKKGDFLEFI